MDLLSMELMSNGDIIGLVIPNLLNFGTLVLKCFCRNGIVFLPRIIIFLERLAKPVGFFFFSFRNFHTMEGLVDVSDILSGPVSFHDRFEELDCTSAALFIAPPFLSKLSSQPKKLITWLCSVSSVAFKQMRNICLET